MENHDPAVVATVEAECRAQGITVALSPFQCDEIVAIISPKDANRRTRPSTTIRTDRSVRETQPRPT